MVTFLPTLLLEERDISLKLGGSLLAFLYYGLIPSSLMGGLLRRKVLNRKLLPWVPALMNVVFGVEKLNVLAQEAGPTRAGLT